MGKERGRDQDNEPPFPKNVEIHPEPPANRELSKAVSLMIIYIMKVFRFRNSWLIGAIGFLFGVFPPHLFAKSQVSRSVLIKELGRCQLLRIAPRQADPAHFFEPGSLAGRELRRDTVRAVGCGGVSKCIHSSREVRARGFRETLCTSIAAIHAGLLVSVHIFTVLRHQVGPAQRVDVAYGGMAFTESGLEGLVVHVHPVTRIAAGTAVVLGGGGIEVPVLLQIGNIGEWSADIHVVLDIVPQRKMFVDIVTL